MIAPGAHGCVSQLSPHWMRDRLDRIKQMEREAARIAAASPARCRSLPRPQAASHRWWVSRLLRDGVWARCLVAADRPPGRGAIRYLVIHNPPGGPDRAAWWDVVEPGDAARVLRHYVGRDGALVYATETNSCAADRAFAMLSRS